MAKIFRDKAGFLGRARNAALRDRSIIGAGQPTRRSAAIRSTCSCIDPAGDDELDRLYALYRSGLDLAAQRAAARRRLVETAPEAARALLNRLSLLMGSFQQPVALELAELSPEIQAVSEHLEVAPVLRTVWRLG